MTWKIIGDIEPRYNHTTLVAGDIKVMSEWRGAEEAGYPDDEFELKSGEIMVFELDLLHPTVFVDGDSISLVAGNGPRGTRDIEAELFANCAGTEIEEVTWGTFEVTKGAMVLSCSDHATHGEDTPDTELSETGYEDGHPRIPKQIPNVPVRIGTSMMVIPCRNGIYKVCDPVIIETKEYGGGFTKILKIIIRKS